MRPVTLLFAVLWASALSLPSKRRCLRESDCEEEPMEVDDSPTPSPSPPIPADAECHFKIDRLPRDVQRSPLTSSNDCPPNQKLRRLSDLIDDTMTQLHGASDVAALIKQRGEAIYDEAWRETANVTYICDYHVRSLGITENFKTYGKQRRLQNDKDACSMPSELGTKHNKNVAADNRKVEVKDAEAVIKVHKVHIYAGSPVCKAHRAFLDEVLAEYLRSQTPADIEGGGKCLPRHKDVNEVAESEFYQFAKTMGREMQCPRTNFTESALRTKRYKVAQMETVFEFIAKIRAPFDYKHLQQAVCDRTFPPAKVARVEPETEAIGKFLSLYSNATEKYLTKWSLATLAQILPYSQIREYLPDLTTSKYYAAKRAYSLIPSTEEPIQRMKYNKTAVYDFISFITSSYITVGLPYGTLTAKTTSGQTVDIPNSLRSMGDANVIAAYKEYLLQENLGEPGLSESTMRRILKRCAASKRVAQACVDNFVADADKAYKNVLEIVEKYKTKDKNAVEQLKLTVHEFKQYLRTDYGLHVKQASKIADHCYTWALSDPEEDKFRTQCDSNNELQHTHAVRCQRCTLFETAINGIKKLLQADIDEVKEGLRRVRNAGQRGVLEKQKMELEDLLKDLGEAQQEILALKKHIVRSKVSEETRKRIVEELKPNTALLTIDFAQKILPMEYREAQRDYFGKRGMSLHVTHVQSKDVDGNFQQAVIAHVFDSVKQDSSTVRAILEHVSEMLEAVGIVNVTIRSDNAGYYKSSATLASLPQLVDEGINVVRYSFSEPQAGKGPADRGIAKIKNKIRLYMNEGNSVTNAMDILKAMKYGRDLEAYHFYLVELTSDDAGRRPTLAIPEISKLQEFRFDHSAKKVLVHRCDGIGEGKILIGESHWKISL